MLTDVILLLGLILLNGVFAMSEIAIVSSRRTRLLQMADAGGSGARHALRLASEPTRFLSSVQVGITSIGILNGAIGEASIATRLRPSLEQVPSLAPNTTPQSSTGILAFPSRSAVNGNEAAANWMATPAMTAAWRYALGSGRIHVCLDG
jgi:putative hemolysin